MITLEAEIEKTTQAIFLCTDKTFLVNNLNIFL